MHRLIETIEENKMVLVHNRNELLQLLETLDKEGYRWKDCLRYTEYLHYMMGALMALGTIGIVQFNDTHLCWVEENHWPEYPSVQYRDIVGERSIRCQLKY